MIKALTLIQAICPEAVERALTALDAMSPPFNPDDCVTCEHRHEPQGGHCYMFKEPPQRKCGQYRKDDALSFGDEFAQRPDEAEVP